MNVLEYGYYDPASDEKEIKENIAKAISYSVDVVSLLPSYLRCAKNIVKDKSTLSAVIDYPFGLSCINARKAETENALKSGAKLFIFNVIFSLSLIFLKKIIISKIDLLCNFLYCFNYI